MELLASVVNVDELLMTVVAALISALAVALVASLGIWGGTKYVDYVQEGRTVAAVMALGVGALGLLATIAVIVLGIILMVAK